MIDKFNDLISAINEDGFTALFEDKSFQAFLTDGIAQAIPGAGGEIIGSIIGAAAPRINGVILTYRQKRFERNIKKLVNELAARIELLEHNYVSLNDEMQEKYRGLFVEMLLDNVVDERQEEKVSWNANGFISLMTNDSNDDIMQIFFDTLSEVTVLDVDTLKMYSFMADVDYNSLVDKYGIDAGRLKLVKEKLVRLGLLDRKNDLIRDNNLDEIIEYLKKVDSESKKSKPQGVRFPSKIKKISSSDSYSITSLGRSFLRTIGEESITN